MIEVQGLVKRFGVRTILDGLDFYVEKGEWVAVVGVNGAGKTTFLRILAGISSFTSGNVSIDGISMTEWPIKVRALTGLVPHQPLLYGDLTAEENLQFYCGLFGVPDPKQSIQKYLQLIGLEKNRKQMVRTFSRGMQQRLTIIRVLMHDPKVLLLDEPTSSLDQEAFGVVSNLLGNLKNEGKTIVMATHDMQTIGQMVTRTVILQDGKLNEQRAQKKVRSSIRLNKRGSKIQ
jgi:heme exporter protein A